tara:strand:+ start:12897 stop:14027 length:1131 start_codon:yes stop_codon:yes gene_type:complete
MAYSDPELFEEEKQRILARAWRFGCHDSELPDPFDFRTIDHAEVPLVMIRGEDGKVRTFYNVCSHRGAKLFNDLSGNARTKTCFFHHWTFDWRGDCVSRPRPQPYEALHLEAEDCGLKEVATDSQYGLIFFNLDDDAGSLTNYLGDALSAFEQTLTEEPVEVFHYHQAEIQANWKQWVESNMDHYHEWMHVMLRRTNVITEETLFHRKAELHSGGHITFRGMEIDYEHEGTIAPREQSKAMPGLTAETFQATPLFPNTVLMTRGTVMRIDTTTPLTPDTSLVEFRGLGLKDDTEEDRMVRIRQHNEFWGPMSHNLPEDLFAAEQCAAGYRSGGAAYGIICREENLSAQDDGGMRHFYAEWSKWMGRSASDPKIITA